MVVYVHASFFLCSLVRLFLFCCLDTTCKHYYVIKIDQNLWYCFTLGTRSFHVSKMYQKSRLITHNSELKVPELKM